MNTSVSVSIKSKNFALLVIHVYSTCLHEIRRSLEEKIKKAPLFLLEKPPVIINVSSLNYHSNWNELYKTISNTGLSIIGVCCCHDHKLRKTILRSGIPILTDNKNTSQKDFPKYSYTAENSVIFKTQLIDAPIRSGQKIYARNRDLIITTNVSAGAEVIADGNIHIYGVMRGRVLAGASGNKTAQIFCTHLYPELVSIGGLYWLSDQIPKEFSGKPVRLSLKKDTLFIQNL